MKPNYERSGKIEQPAPPPAETSAAQEGGIRVNGFEQVFEMLVVADPQFRESLLVRIETRNRQLGFALRKRLANNR